jgi:enoyl-[acyl-carrier-protein] reductase (NADH)
VRYLAADFGHRDIRERDLAGPVRTLRAPGLDARVMFNDQRDNAPLREP